MWIVDNATNMVLFKFHYLVEYDIVVLKNDDYTYKKDATTILKVVGMSVTLCLSPLG